MGARRHESDQASPARNSPRPRGISSILTGRHRFRPPPLVSQWDYPTARPPPILCPLIGFRDSDADRLGLAITLFKQCIGDLDRLAPDFRRQVLHRSRLVNLVPRHRVFSPGQCRCSCRSRQPALPLRPCTQPKMTAACPCHSSPCHTPCALSCFSGCPRNRGKSSYPLPCPFPQRVLTNAHGICAMRYTTRRSAPVLHSLPPHPP
jgi:hypothetical protein